MTMLIGMATSLPLLLALMFCVSDLDAVVNSQLPSMEVIYQAYEETVYPLIILGKTNDT